MTFVYKGLRNTDLRISEGKPVTPAFLFAVLLWEPVRGAPSGPRPRAVGALPAIQQAGAEVVDNAGAAHCVAEAVHRADA